MHNEIFMDLYAAIQLPQAFSVGYVELTYLDYFVLSNAWNDKTIFVSFCLPKQNQRVWPLSSVTIFFERRY
jgi:hypothetical protein